MPTRKRKETPVQVLRRSIQRVDRLMRQVKRLDADRAAWYRRATMVHRGIGAARVRRFVQDGERREERLSRAQAALAEQSQRLVIDALELLDVDLERVVRHYEETYPTVPAGEEVPDADE
jgi:hypothetical protein